MTIMIIELNKYKKQLHINTPHYLNQKLCYRYFPIDTYLRHILFYMNNILTPANFFFAFFTAI